MTSDAGEVGVWLSNVAEAVDRWSQAAIGRQAQLLSDEPKELSNPAVVAVTKNHIEFALLESLLCELIELHSAVENASADSISSSELAVLRELWLHIQAELGERHVSPTADHVLHVREFRTAIETYCAPDTPVVAIFQSGTHSLDTLKSEFGKALSRVNWAEKEATTGVVFPDSVKSIPVNLDTYTDGFGGDATFSVEFAPWSTQDVSNKVKDIFEKELLPEVRANLGENSVGEKISEVKAPDATICEILFGTNRERKGTAFTGSCSQAPNPLSYGMARVSVPNRRKRGAVPRPWNIVGISLPEDASKHMVLTEAPKLITEEEFRASIKAAGSNAAFVFVHGYNTSFEGGLYRTAQLATDLEVEGPVLHYAWPSGGQPWLYDFDSENVKASRNHFKTFVKSILDGGITALNVVAHSKGNELVLEAFAELAAELGQKPLMQHLVLASPDVAVAVGADRLKSVPSLFKSVTLYANAFDKPLLVSGGKAAGSRIGGELPDHHPFIAKDVDTIDAANTSFEWFGLNHDAYVASPILMYDLKAILERGIRPPDQRSPIIQPRDCERGRYYQIVTR